MNPKFVDLQRLLGMTCTHLREDFTNHFSEDHALGGQANTWIAIIIRTSARTIVRHHKVLNQSDDTLTRWVSGAPFGVPNPSQCFAGLLRETSPRTCCGRPFAKNR